jgi:hypothetical protein
LQHIGTALDTDTGTCFSCNKKAYTKKNCPGIFSPYGTGIC